MSNNTIVGIMLAVILLCGGYYLYTQRDAMGQGTTQGQPMEGPAVPEGASGKVAAYNEDGTYNDPMYGTWESTEDAKFTREFRSDGTVIDRYEGDASATATGTWSVVDPAAEAQFIDAPLGSLEGMSVVRIAFPEGNYYFSINKITETELAMTYLGRGNILVFTKVR